MPATCSVCAHPDRDAIDESLVRGVPYRAISRQHGVGRDSVARHAKSGHVPIVIVVSGERHEAERAESLTQRAEFLWRRAAVILDQSEGRPNVELSAIRELRQVVELLGRLTSAFAGVEEHPLVIDLSLSDGTPFPSLPWGRD